MATTIQLKRGKSTSWTSLDLVLEPGEPGFEIDTGRLKIGNGIDSWNELKYVGEDGRGVVNATTHYDFPSVGDENFIYKAAEEKKIYQWNAVSLTYELISEDEEDINVNDIKIIHGGNANGTT